MCTCGVGPGWLAGLLAGGRSLAPGLHRDQGLEMSSANSTHTSAAVGLAAQALYTTACACAAIVASAAPWRPLTVAVARAQHVASLAGAATRCRASIAAGGASVTAGDLAAVCWAGGRHHRGWRPGGGGHLAGRGRPACRGGPGARLRHCTADCKAQQHDGCKADQARVHVAWGR